MKAAKRPKRPQPTLNFQVPEWALARVRQECERRGEIQGGVYGVARLFTDMCLELTPAPAEGITISSPLGLVPRKEPPATPEPRRKPVKSVPAAATKVKKAGA